MTDNDHELLLSLRKQVADYICEYLKEDCGHKSYEGTWEVLMSYPNYFQDNTATASPNFYRVALHCYILGPARYYDWDGETLQEALMKCKHDIDQWTKE